MPDDRHGCPPRVLGGVRRHAAMLELLLWQSRYPRSKADGLLAMRAGGEAGGLLAMRAGGEAGGLFLMLAG